jgi:hypothetical protein
MMSIKITATDLSGIKDARNMRLSIDWATKEALGYVGVKGRREIQSYIKRGGSGWQRSVRKSGKGWTREKQPLRALASMVIWTVGKSKGLHRVTIKPGLRGAKGKDWLGRMGKAHLAGTVKREKMTPASLFKKAEMGKRYRVTKKMRGHMAAIGMPLKKSTKQIVVPARPVFGPLWFKVRGQAWGWFEKKFFAKMIEKNAQLGTTRKTYKQFRKAA